MTNQQYQDLEPVYHDKESALYNWVFHFNHYTGVWAAIPRELYGSYWNDSQEPGVIRSKSFQTLLEIIQRTNGDCTKIEQLTREQ